MSLHEVAKRAGVSTATVSRTINRPADVNPKTAERVWKAIQELDYLPNIQARSLVSGRSRILGLIVSDITNPFFPELVKEFENLCVEHDYEILISSTNYDTGRMEICVRRMLQRMVEGVAIMTSEMSNSFIDEFSRRNVPLVFLDLGVPKDRISTVRVDYRAGITQAVEHLLGLGHRRIAFVSGPQAVKSARIRRSAFLSGLAKAGIGEGERLVEESDHTVEGGLLAMERLLRIAKPPTAVLASNDVTAIGALRAIRRAGLRVPQEISVVGFDDIQLAGYTDPPLTTVRFPRDEIARHAFHALLHHLQNGAGGLPAPPPLVSSPMVKTHLVIRESTGPAAPAKITSGDS